MRFRWSFAGIVVLSSTILLAILYLAALRDSLAVGKWLGEYLVQVREVLTVAFGVALLLGAGVIGGRWYVAWSERARARSLANRGIAEFRSGRRRSALNVFSMALACDPRSAPTLVYRGQVYQEMGNHEAALDNFSSALDIDPRYSLAYIARGVSYREMGAYDSAIVALTRALEISPGSDMAYWERGETYRFMGDEQAAHADCARCGTQVDAQAGGV